MPFRRGPPWARKGDTRETSAVLPEPRQGDALDERAPREEERRDGGQDHDCAEPRPILLVEDWARPECRPPSEALSLDTAQRDALHERPLREEEQDDDRCSHDDRRRHQEAPFSG